MVYLDPGELRWKPYVLTWLDNLPVQMSDTTKVSCDILVIKGPVSKSLLYSMFP